MNYPFKKSMMRYFIISLFFILILTACNSSKLIHEDEKKCPYLEG
jgi:hypothetical protein